jgi:hypothetical protein
MRRSYMRRLYTIAAAIIIVAGLGTAGIAGVGGASAATAGPAHAAATPTALAADAPCQGSSCAGRDPALTGCNQYPVIRQPTPVMDQLGLVTLRIWSSATCNAKWAQAILSPTALADGYYLSVNIDTTDAAGTDEFMCFPGPSNTGLTHEGCGVPYYKGSDYAYTDMVDGTNTATAEVDVSYYTGTGYVTIDSAQVSL